MTSIICWLFGHKRPFSSCFDHTVYGYRVWCPRCHKIIAEPKK
jgi:hypothetical protein